MHPQIRVILIVSSRRPPLRGCQRPGPTLQPGRFIPDDFCFLGSARWLRPRLVRPIPVRLHGRLRGEKRGEPLVIGIAETGLCDSAKRDVGLRKRR
ncbi:hypothetical protein MRX96_057725 [Rhipicephalus microplus]